MDVDQGADHCSPGEKSRHEGRSHTAGGWGPKGFAGGERLAPHEQESGRGACQSHRQPVKSKGAGVVPDEQRCSQAGRGSDQTDGDHHRSQCAPVDRSPFHEGSDGSELFPSQVLIHGLHSQVRAVAVNPRVATSCFPDGRVTWS
ncbi:MAG: hypothetical protein RLZZ582_2627 [Verrucomicrobiota bacterium]